MGNLEEKGNLTLKAAIPHILFLCSIFYLNFLSRILLAPLMPSVERDLGIGHTKAGSLFFFLSSGYCTSMLLSGFVAKRITHKGTISLSGMGIGVVLILLSCSTSYRSLALCLIVLGLVSGLYLPSGLSTITSLVSSRDWGKAFSIHEWAPNLAFITAPLLAELLLRWMSWKNVFSIVGFACLVVSITYFKFGKGGKFPGESPNLSIIKDFVSNRSFWVMLFIFGLGVGGTIGVYNMLPLYLVSERGFSESWVNAVVGLSRVSGLFITLLSGWLTDRIGPKGAIAMVFTASGISTAFLGFLKGSLLLPVIFLQPLFATCFFPPGLSALSRIAKRRVQNIAVSFTVPFAFLFGSGAVPAFIGFMGDVSSFGYGFLVVGLVTAGSISLLKFLRFVEE